MKMKRWISMLLTLALCLGLLPGAALAEEVTDAEIGLKLCADAAGTTEVSKVDGVYNVGIAEGVTTTVYLHITGGDNAVFANGTSFTMTVNPPAGEVTIVSSKLLENNTVLEITHHGDRDWNTMENTRTITVGEKEFSFAIKFVNSDSGTEETDPVDATLIYDDKGKNGVTVNAGDSEAFTFPPQIYIDGALTQLTYEDYTTNYTFTCDTVIGKLFWYTEFSELGIDTTNATPGATGAITVTNNSDSDKVYTYTVTIMASSGDDNEDGDSTETTLESGVYTTLTDGQLGGFIEMARIYGDEGPWGYRVSYTTGQSVTVYYYNPNQLYTCNSENVDYAAVEGLEGVYAITLHTGKIGAVSVDLTYGDGGFPIVFDDGSSGGEEEPSELQTGVYATLTDGQLGGFIEMARIYGDEGPWGYRVPYATGQSVTVYYYNLNQVYTCNSENVDYAAVEGLEGVYAITLHTGKSGEVSVDLTYGDGGFPIVFDDGTDGGNQDDGNDSFYTLISPKRDLVAADKVGFEDLDSMENGPVSFEYNGKTYYLCTMAPREEEEGAYRMSYAGGGAQNYHEGASFQSQYCIGIWTANATKDYYTLIDGEEKATLLAAFESWSVTAYHSPDHHVLNGYPSTAYPEIYSWIDENGWPCGTMFKHDEDGLGNWYYKFTGTMKNGTTVTTYVKNGFHFIYNSYEYAVTSVADANAKLQEWRNTGYSDENTYQINLPSGELSGIIRVPVDMVNVDICGSSSDERTVLKGGIGGAGYARVKNIDFVGCGWWAINWPNNDVYGGAPNYGLYTAGGGQYENCTFKNYFHALHCGPNDEITGRIIFGGEQSLFENNFIALYLNSTMNGGGNLGMTENTFCYNGCALWLENTGNRFTLNDYHLTRCKFYDNGWDVINLLGKCYFLPGQLFERDGEYGHGKFAGRRDALSDPPVENAPDKAYHAATDVSEKGSSVYTFPVAKDDKFNDFDYTNKDAVIGNQNASDWLIPEKDLDGKTITVIQDEKGEDKVVWSFGE